MYESPIRLIQQVANDIAERQNELIYEEVVRCCVDVDKKELLKALQYDREQYEQGYEDGKRDAVTHAHWIFMGDWFECSECGYRVRAFEYDNYCPFCGAKMDGDAR